MTAWAAAYLRIPFLDRGNDRSGCDCWGLLRLILAEQCGIALPDYAGTVEAGDWKTKVRELTGGAAGADWREIEKGRERAFDGVLMRGQFRNEGRLHSRPVHVGVVIDPGRLIHTEAGSGVTIADYRNHPAMRSRVVGFYRFAGAA